MINIKAGNLSSGNPITETTPQLLTQLLIKEVTLTTTAQDLFVGVDILADRKQLLVINDSSKLVYLNKFTPFTLDGNNMIAFSGENITYDLGIDIDTGLPMRIYARTAEGTTKIRIFEVK